VGARNAQTVADLMLSGGIRAIWNFAPTPLDLPEGIILENEDLSGTLAVISRRLTASSK
jgi:redox-sensing transcriptional repressor